MVTVGILSCLRGNGGLLVERSLQARELLSPGLTEFGAFRETKERWACAKDYSPNTGFKELAFIHRFFWEDTNPFSKSNTMTLSFLCSGMSIMPCYHQERVKLDIFSPNYLSPITPSFSLPCLSIPHSFHKHCLMHNKVPVPLGLTDLHGCGFVGGK